MNPAMALCVKMGLEGAGNIANVSCPSCDFVAISHTQFTVQPYAHFQNRCASADPEPARRPALFKRPSIGTCCKPANWANFKSAWERYRMGSNVKPDSAVFKFI